MDQWILQWEKLAEHNLFQPLFTLVALIFFWIVMKISYQIVDKRYKKRLQKIHTVKDKVFKSFKIGEYEIINSKVQKMLLVNFYRILKYLILFLIMSAILPLLFWLNPESKKLIIYLLQQMVIPIKSVGMAIVNYIPNLITIIVVVFIIRLLVRVVNYLTNEIYNKRLVINKFYPEWAKPTGTTIKIFLYVLTLVVVAPYLPGSGSSAFKGISVMAGILISMGTSSSVGNAISGLILTYMRSFKIGDKVIINETEGFVVEKSLLVTRVKTAKNERVTIPNSSILSNPIINHSYSADNYNLAIYTTVTIGYDVDWRVVHKLLIDSAKRVGTVLDSPAPYVLQVSLNDFYVEYQLNAYVNDASGIPKVKSEIHQNIQDAFKEKEIEILSPHYRMQRKDYTFEKSEMGEYGE